MEMAWSKEKMMQKKEETKGVDENASGRQREREKS